jgi:hypothetical protein
MTRILSPKQIRSVLCLDGDQRYNHFIKVICDEGFAWGLWNDGWALSGTNDGEQFFPLWPASHYSDLCISGEWIGCRSQRIPVEELVGGLVPYLLGVGKKLTIFPTPNSGGVVPEIQKFISDITTEMQNY